MTIQRARRAYNHPHTQTALHYARNVLKNKYTKSPTTLKQHIAHIKRMNPTHIKMLKEVISRQNGGKVGAFHPHIKGIARGKGIATAGVLKAQKGTMIKKLQAEHKKHGPRGGGWFSSIKKGASSLFSWGKKKVEKAQSTVNKYAKKATDIYNHPLTQLALSTGIGQKVEGAVKKKVGQVMQKVGAVKEKVEQKVGKVVQKVSPWAKFGKSLLGGGIASGGGVKTGGSVRTRG